MDNLSTTTAEDFKGAVRTLLTEISLQNINVQLGDMGVIERDALVNEIATQTKIHLIGKDKCCRAVMGFFKAEATADDLRDKAKAIAASVATNHAPRFGKTEIAMAQLKQEPLLAPELSQQNGMRDEEGNTILMATPIAEAGAWEEPEQAMRSVVASRGMF